jgi:hypothetical protein
MQKYKDDVIHEKMEKSSNSNTFKSMLGSTENGKQEQLINDSTPHEYLYPKDELFPLSQFFVKFELEVHEKEDN